MTYITLRNRYNQPLFTKGAPVLQYLDIELTERCNNACKHCFINLPIHDQNALAKELNTADWQDILRQAADLGALSVKFTGGEPLLRDDFAELYLYARRLGMTVKLFTNARLITNGLAEMFSRIPPLEKIEITVYGMHPETYDVAACAPGGYVEFRRGVERLLEEGIPFIVKGALLPDNMDDREEFEEWAKTIPWMENHPSYVMFFYQRGRPCNLALRQKIDHARINPEKGVALISSRPDYRDEMKQFCQQFTHPSGAQLFNCGAGIGGGIDAYGFYQPCLMLRDPNLTTNLNTTSLRDAVLNTRPNLFKMTASRPDYLERCAHCFLRGLCESCPAASYAEHGCLDQPVEYLCQVAHAKARDLGLLDEKEKAWEVQDWKERLENLNTKESL